jgi:ABC-type bacteriocin/lantibiotic exporter with double-glycine peptidase domain
MRRREMKDGKSVKGELRLVTIWPLLMFPFIILVVLVLFFVDHEAGLVALIFACLYLAFCVWWTLYWQPRLKGKIADMAAEYTRMQKRQKKTV